MGLFSLVCIISLLFLLCSFFPSAMHIVFFVRVLLVFLLLVHVLVLLLCPSPSPSWGPPLPATFATG